MFPNQIDFRKEQDGRINVLKMRRDAAGRRNITTSHELKPANFDLQAALAWCEENGYTVRRWSYGARAWLGAPRPVRTRREIWQIRRRLELESLHFWERRTVENHSAGAQPGSRWHQVSVLLALDLAYDG